MINDIVETNEIMIANPGFAHRAVNLEVIFHDETFYEVKYDHITGEVKMSEDQRACSSVTVAFQKDGRWRLQGGALDDSVSVRRHTGEQVPFGSMPGDEYVYQAVLLHNYNKQLAKAKHGNEKNDNTTKNNI